MIEVVNRDRVQISSKYLHETKAFVLPPAWPTLLSKVRENKVSRRSFHSSWRSIASISLQRPELGEEASSNFQSFSCMTQCEDDAFNTQVLPSYTSQDKDSENLDGINEFYGNKNTDVELSHSEPVLFEMD
jgi:hypothetical protein